MCQTQNEGLYVAESVMRLLIASSRNANFTEMLKHLRDFRGSVIQGFNDVSKDSVSFCLSSLLSLQVA